MRYLFPSDKRCNWTLGSLGIGFETALMAGRASASLGFCFGSSFLPSIHPPLVQRQLNRPPPNPRRRRRRRKSRYNMNRCAVRPSALHTVFSSAVGGEVGIHAMASVRLLMVMVLTCFIHNPWNNAYAKYLFPAQILEHTEMRKLSTM